MKTKAIGLAIVAVFLLVFVFLTYTHILWTVRETNFPLSTFVYLSLVLLLFSLIIFFKLKSSFSLWLGFTLFIFGSLATTFSLFSFSEPLFRLSFVFFIVGLGQSLLEYKRSHG